MELVLSIEDTKEVANTKIKRLHYVPHQAPEQVVVSEATGCMCYIPRYGVHSARLRKSRVFISMSSHLCHHLLLPHAAEDLLSI